MSSPDARPKRPENGLHDLIRGTVVFFISSLRGIARGLARTLREEVCIEVGSRERSRKASILEIVIRRLGIFTFMDPDIRDVGALKIQFHGFGDIETSRRRAQAVHPGTVDTKVVV